MKATGIIRTIDEMGRIVLPQELRNTMELTLQDPVEFFVDDFDNIIIKKVETGCVFCDNTLNTIQYKGKTVCQQCLSRL